MKRTFKRFITIFFSVTLIFTFSIHSLADNTSDEMNLNYQYANAEEYLTENFSDIIQYIYQGRDYFEEVANVLHCSYVMPGFEIIDLNEDENNVITKCFPIMCDNEVTAVISVDYADGKYSCTISESFGSIINDTYVANYTLVRKENNLYYINGKDITELHIRDNNVVLKNEDISDIYFKLDTKQVKDLTMNQNTESVLIDCSEYITEYSINATRSSTILANFPIVGQNPNGTNYSLCWAACIAAIHNYQSATAYTAKGIVDSFPDIYNNIYLPTYEIEDEIALENGYTRPTLLTENQVLNYAYNKYFAPAFPVIRSTIMPHYFDTVTPYLNAVTISTLTTQINNGYPLYIHSEVTPNSSSDAASGQFLDDSFYHAVVAYGYSTGTSTYSIYIMDPLDTGSMIIGVYDSSDPPISYSAGGSGQRMYFRRAVVLREN